MLTSVQLKNTINAFFSSQSRGTKSFLNDGFGRKTVFDLYTCGDVVLEWFQSCVSHIFCVTLGQN